MRIFYLFLVASLLNGCGPNQKVDSSSRPDIDALISLSKKMSTSSYDSALVLSLKAYKLSSDYGYSKGQAHAALVSANLLYQIGGYARSMDYLNESLVHFRKLNDTQNLTEVYFLIGLLYLRADNFDLAYEFFIEAKKLSISLADKGKLAKVYGNIGHLFEKKEAFDSALYYQQLALDYYSTSTDTLGLASIHDNIGSIYEDLGDFDEAFFHFQMALVLNTSIANYEQAIVNTNNIGDIFRKKGDLKNALLYTKKAQKLSKKANLDYQVKSANRDLSKIYLALGDVHTAFYYLDSAYEMTDNIFSAEIASQIAKTRSIYELDQNKQRIELLEKEKHYEQSLTRVFGSVALLFFLLGGFIIYQQRSKSIKSRKLLKAETLLARKELENAQLSEQKLIAILENKQLREDQLHQEIELKGKSLTNSALHMIQKNEFLQDIRAKLSDLKKGSPDTVEKKVKRLIKSIDMNFSLDEDWQEFESIFEQVHSDFYKKLKNLYPDLSASEVRLCAMIRLNLQSKDMAAIMGISHDSLRIARYRLRKHLGLSKGSNLYAFLVNVA